MIPDKTFDDLGWGQLLEQIARRARTERGEQAARELALLDEPEQAEQRIAEIAEVRALTDLAAEPPFGGISDVRPAVARAEKGGVLEGEALLAVARATRGCHELGRHLLRHRDTAPRLAEIAAEIDDLGHVFHPILESFDDDGRLADHASDSLGELRRRVTTLKGKLERRAQELVDDPAVQKHLQDNYYTQRDDRYVVPVKVSARPWVKGIVHGTSHSGQTLFIEPDAIVDLNNSLKLAECEVADEELRILMELTAYVAEEADAIRFALEVATGLDVIAAAARLADDLAATSPIIDRDGAIDLRDMRHPLMVASGRDCVPNDLVMRPRSVLVISGPNAGGKTVALKSAGLAALMVRAGLHLPAASESRFPWFEDVLCDIGDAQSIEMDLSTFSAHLQQLQRFLDRAGPATLVLIDEVAVGTEPEQGAALARAVLEQLAGRGVATVVTTHYEALKALAAADDRFDNASVGFDMERMEPTFRLHLGTPGSSGAIRVARRMGLPETVLVRAEEILGAGRAGVEEVLAELEAARVALEEERSQAEEARRRAERAEREASSARAAADAARKKLHEGIYDDALESLRQARAEIDRLRKQTRRRKVTVGSDVSEERAALAELGGEVARHAPERPAPPGRALAIDEVKPGLRVFVVPLGGEGEIASEPDRGKVQVRVGALKTTAELGDLRLVAGAPKSGRKPSRPRPSPPPEPARPTGEPTVADDDERAFVRTPDVTVDVRGERVDAAVARVDQFIDDSLRQVRECVFVIHGHGTGALRQAVRELLGTHPSVRKFRAGVPREGGDGVTVAWLDVA